MAKALPSHGKPLLLVEWTDSSSPSAQVWQDTQEFLDGHNETLACRTVGFLMYETEDRIGLASSLALAGGEEPPGEPVQVTGTIVIPKVAIQKMRKLK